MIRSTLYHWNPRHFLKRLFVLLVGCELSILLLDIAFNHYKVGKIGAIRRLFNITREDGIANFFSSFQLIAVGVVLFAIYSLSCRVYHNREFIRHKGWLVLSVFFTFMGFDDATKFHERMGTTAKMIFASDGSRGIASDSIFDIFPSYAWQIVMGPFFVLMGLFILWYLLRKFDDSKSKILFLAALSFYVLAVFMDFIEGYGTGPYAGLADSMGLAPRQVRHLAKAVEETFEMFGTTLFLMCFLRHFFALIKTSEKIEISVQ